MEPSVKCPWCPRFLNTSQGLKSHITRLHKGCVDKDSGRLDIRSDGKGLPIRAPASISEGCSQTLVKTVFSNTTSSLPSQDENPQSSGFSQEEVTLESLLANLRCNIKVIHRIPKGARSLAAEALSTTIDRCVQDKSVEAWKRLLLFCATCLQVPDNQESRKVSLATLVKRNVSGFLQGQTIGKCESVQKETKPRNNEKQLAKRVEAKVAEGDMKGAIRIMSSEDAFAPYNDDTVSSLVNVHPVRDPTAADPPEPPDKIHGVESLQVTDSEVRGAVLSFPPGSAGGLDMLRPQHLKDLVSPAVGNSGLRLLSSITKLCNLMLAGNVPLEICPVLYGASLCALLKKDGGIRPIAIGSTWRRLVAKMGSNHIRSRLSGDFYPSQVGFGINGGAEAAAHAARRFVTFDHKVPKVFLKIDFRNAFNTINRTQMLQAASGKMPELYPFLCQCYNEPSRLAFGEKFLSSESGIQQGDPLGPGLFCMVTHPVATSMASELNIWYLDDGALGGLPNVVLEDFDVLKTKAKDLGLEINSSKCELFILQATGSLRSNIQKVFQKVIPNVRIPKDSECSLLGAPLLPEALENCIETKTLALGRISKRLQLVKAHVAFMIIKNSQAIPKLTYVLRCAPTWRCEDALKTYDETLKEALETVTNIRLEEDAWEQTALPIAMGGLGIRHAQSSAIPAFLASVHSVSRLTSAILPTEIAEDGDPMCSEGISLWTRKFGTDIPAEEKRRFQKQWEAPGVKLSGRSIHDRAATVKDKARLLGAASRESGAFLNVLPSVPLGTMLENDALRISIALRLGAKICQEHVCSCGVKVDESGVHGLSCIKSAGRRARHAAVNDIIRRGLVSAKIPAVLEPPNLALDSNTRPDGVTQIPWIGGKPLVWDFTCTDGMATSHVSSAAVEPLYAASVAEQNKRRKYAHLSQGYVFTPIAVECLGSFGSASLDVVRSIGRKITEATGEKRATEYLIQRISVAIQRGNASSIMGTIPSASSLEDYFTFL